MDPLVDSASATGAEGAATAAPSELDANSSGIISSLFADLAKRRFGVVVGGVGLLLPGAETTELLPYPALTRLPLAPPVVAGMMNARGTLLTVFDLTMLSGWDKLPAGGSGGEKPMILMVGNGDDVYGLLIQGFPKTHQNLPSAAMPTIPEEMAEYVIAAFRDADERIWLDFDVARMLSDRAGNAPGDNTSGDNAPDSADN